jgi:hypothetical protein
MKKVKSYMRIFMWTVDLDNNNSMPETTPNSY